MKVLITGGYGFIGSTVAERFHKEGHQIYIIDNLSTGRKEHLTVPHKAYIRDVEDPSLDEIFASVSFDVVVHLAAQVNVAISMNEPVKDSRTNVVGLANILNCSVKHGVKKLLFASSAAVYGDADAVPLAEKDLGEIQSVYGMNKWMGELYCDMWSRSHGMDTLVLRFANVYGPKQGNCGEGGAVSVFMEAALKGKPVCVFGDGSQTRDFIFVGDIADAVLRGATSEAKGIMNLSTSRETSINELIGMIGELHPISEPEYREPRPGDIVRSCLDNSVAKKALDWVPLFSVREGLTATYEWMSAQLAEEAPVAASKPRRRWLGKALKLRGYAENLLLLVGVIAYMTMAPASLSSTGIDLILVYILLMGLFYGTRQSVLATAGVVVYLFIHNLMEGWYWGNVLTDTHFLFQSSVYLFFGLAVGFVKDRYSREKLSQAGELNLIQERYDFLMDVYKDTRDVKDSLQKQVLTSKDSLGRLHAIVAELESLVPEQIVMKSVNVIEELMESRRIAIYAVAPQSSYIRLIAQSSDDSFQAPKSIDLAESPAIASVIRTGAVFINKGLEANTPAMAAPVMNNGQATAVILLQEQSFDNFTLYYENLFRIAVSLISRSLSRTFKYIEATRQERFVEDTTILQEAQFLEIVQSKKEARDRKQSEFAVLVLDEVKGELREIAPRLTSALRTTDYIGLLKRRVAILLSSTSQNEVKFAVARLEKGGFKTRILPEEELYV
jgi:UDP-glucuronate decarboxylase